MLLFQISNTSHVMLDSAGTMLMMLDELIHVYECLLEGAWTCRLLGSAWVVEVRYAIGCVRRDGWPSLEISIEIWSRRRRAWLARKSVTKMCFLQL